ncbi:energy transducer TonB [Algoriphagus boritolerans]|uniref:TonB family C-terminal domain-containing protein n=1 Tax=Algoriphagus boritolerans DSM 17298 = JCM 18970 TaxID=1120964 RepID=A0A1H5VRR6_9BACT|nr:energy transducer TonB [Algoriphagus boritolerans]SEF89227.1 TonB family C-terminal domain-containing protein [Algoriphagus boritolerans DSM 17298 = JCM 18970]
MKNNELKISKITGILAIYLIIVFSACDIATEPEIEGPTQVEAKQTLGSSNILSRVNDVAKDGNKIFDVTEVQPNPPGGMEGWNKYLQENLVYPAEAKSMGIEGTVIVVFVVNSDGSISDVEVLRGIGGGADEAAVQVVQNSPNWEPAKQKDQVVNSRMRLPVRFKLS